MMYSFIYSLKLFISVFFYSFLFFDLIKAEHFSEKDIKTILQKSPTLNRNVLKLSLKAYKNFKKVNINRRSIITIIDYSKPSSEKRLWVINLEKKKVVLHDYVGHGKNSGPNQPHRFSNHKDSWQSSIGLLLTAQSYFGKYGYALRVIGLEKEFNSNVAVRNIVFHASKYANEQFIKKHGRLGRTYGCFSIHPDTIKPLINMIKGGTLVFSYYPDMKWLKESRFLA